MTMNIQMLTEMKETRCLGNLCSVTPLKNTEIVQRLQGIIDEAFGRAGW
jgi:hypothetical protein